MGNPRLTAWLSALALCAGCYDAHRNAGQRAAERPRPQGGISIEPVMTHAHAPAGGAAGAAATPDDPVTAPPPSLRDELGCYNGEAGVYEGDFDTRRDLGTALADLDGVREVRGILAIQDTDSTDLDELHCLSEVGSLHVFDNPQLTSLRGLAQLRDVPGFIYITRNPQLRDISGLRGVTLPLGREPHERCPENAGCALGALAIDDNPALESLAGLEGLPEVLGGVTVRNNPVLAALDGLASVTRVHGDLRIFLNSELRTLGGLTSLAQIDGKLIVEQNAELRDLGSALPLSQAGELIIAGNARLTTLEGLSQIEHVQVLSIAENPSLTRLTGLESLRRVDRLIGISDNAALTSIAALSGVSGQVGSDLEPDHPFMEGVSSVALGIDGNPQLRSLHGLEAVEVIGGIASFTGNANLVDLHGLDGLRRVSTNLEVFANRGLTTLDGLESLERVGRHLLIGNNPALRDIDALGNLTFVGGMLDLRGNGFSDVDLPVLDSAGFVLLP